MSVAAALLRARLVHQRVDLLQLEQDVRDLIPVDLELHLLVSSVVLRVDLDDGSGLVHLLHVTRVILQVHAPAQRLEAGIVEAAGRSGLA